MDQDASSLLRNLLAHLKHEVQLYGTAAPTPCKQVRQPVQPAKATVTPDPQPQPSAQCRVDDAEAQALNNSHVAAGDVAMATIIGKVTARGRTESPAMTSRPVARTPWSARMQESPMQVEQFTGMARASLIDDLSDSSWSRCTPKKLVYSDSPCKDIKDINATPSPGESFSFDVASCCTMLDAVGLDHSGPATPYISGKAASPMDTSPTPAKCSVQMQDVQELSNILIQERAEKLALAAFNQQLLDELAELKKSRGACS